MKVSFYKYGSNSSGYYVQRDVVDKVVQMTKKELMETVDLRHNVLTRKEYYQVMSTDRHGNAVSEFELLGSSHLLKVEPFVKK
jgi:hypothetical protein